MVDDIKAALALLVMMLSVTAVAIVGYKVGINNGRLQVAKHIPEIRRVERMNALAPRTKQND